MLFELTCPAESAPITVSPTERFQASRAIERVDRDDRDGGDRRHRQERREERPHVRLREHDEQQERRQHEEREPRQHRSCVLAEQIDAAEDPSDDDRDAHHDEPRERLQHPSSLLWRALAPCRVAHRVIADNAHYVSSWILTRNVQGQRSPIPRAAAARRPPGCPGARAGRRRASACDRPGPSTRRVRGRTPGHP